MRDTAPQRYAIDVPMPIGTDVLTIRAGRVVSVEESCFDGDKVFGHENHVFAQHAVTNLSTFVDIPPAAR